VTIPWEENTKKYINYILHPTSDSAFFFYYVAANKS